jgi:hypothetical protein
MGFYLLIRDEFEYAHIVYGYYTTYVHINPVYLKKKYIVSFFDKQSNVDKSDQSSNILENNDGLNIPLKPIITNMDTSEFNDQSDNLIHVPHLPHLTHLEYVEHVSDSYKLN